MLEKLASLEEKYKGLSEKIVDPKIIENINEWQKLVKEHAEIEPVVEKYQQYMDVDKQLEENKEMLKEMKKTVDAMTLTATPIPRTLHMALVG